MHGSNIYVNMLNDSFNTNDTKNYQVGMINKYHIHTSQSD